ncbi:hypothetical protein D6D01_03442 [Aureobasidium pullulans]|uniref:BTB domain-containing protein n=1 Tax=Aureobasidium pullulans TaxID=5580 RepID=A0A4S9LLB0_AURPU|nr:hypothetical protein D6D01_03442 [Aureobasidium pullulans]
MSTPPTKPEPGSSTPTTKTPGAITKAVSVATKIPPSNCFQTIVTIEVGAEKKAFMVHKDLLAFYSDYFRGAFDGSFKEATDRKLSLPDDCIGVFNVFNKYIYTRQLSDGEDSDVSWELIVGCWLFGDKYIIPSFQNKIMDVLYSKSLKLKVIPTKSLKLIYNDTLPGAPLRRILVDWAAFRGNMKLMMSTEMNFQWPREALVDLATILGGKKAEEIGVFALPVNNAAKCYYHVHNEGESCPWTGLDLFQRDKYSSQTGTEHSYPTAYTH